MSCHIMNQTKWVSIVQACNWFWTIWVLKLYGQLECMYTFIDTCVNVGRIYGENVGIYCTSPVFFRKVFRLLNYLLNN